MNPKEINNISDPFNDIKKIVDILCEYDLKTISRILKAVAAYLGTSL